jgi:hypothetical protein
MKKTVLILLSLLSLTACGKKASVGNADGFSIVETKNFASFDLCKQAIEDKLKEAKTIKLKSPPLKMPNAYVVQVVLDNGEANMYLCGKSKDKVVYDFLVRPRKK